MIIRNLVIMYVAMSAPLLAAFDGSEKIYAVMITGKDAEHENLAKCAKQSFLEQTYENKHLIVINDGQYTLSDGEDNVTEIRLSEKRKLGALRNIGLRYVPENAVWVQWDDDDWRHPRLIEEQYNYMVSKGASMCALQKQVQYCFRINSAWINSTGFAGIMGTIMCRKKDDVWYPETTKSEDLVFYRTYRGKYKSVVWPNAAHYYLRFIHGNNTWSESHFSINRRVKNVFSIPDEAKNYLMSALNYYRFIQRDSEN